jgi:hypothetical protein
MALVVLGACSTSSGGGPSLRTATQIKDALAKADVACDGTPHPYEAGSDDLDLGAPPQEELVCHPDNVELTVSVWKTSAERRAMMAVAESLVCSFGGKEFRYLADGPWAAATEGDTAADRRVLDQVGAALQVDVTTTECDGGGSSSDVFDSSDDAGTDEEVTTTTEDPDTPGTATFGETFTWRDDLSIVVAPGVPFTPSDTASADDAPAYLVFEITVTNGGTEVYDPAMFTVSMQSGSTEAGQVFDSAQLGDAPQTSLLPGRKATWKVAFGVTDPKDLVMQVSPGFEYRDLLVTTS